ncbi:unnamed protein product [Brassica napus]|uniref:(rape) hypothetical protein n=1 Tax=Brassica napus TaxID=3708 RepID=A0A817B5B4_BRANA|nr:unnamed protein product [Brassica napus]
MAMKSVRLTVKSTFVSVKFPVSDSSIDCGLPMKNMCVLILVYAYLLVNRMIGIGLGCYVSIKSSLHMVHFDSKNIIDNSLENMLGTPTDVANVYVLTIPPNRVAMFHRAPRLHQEFSLTRMCLRQLITSLSMYLCLPQTGTYSGSCMSSSLARCKNHLCRSVTADIKGEKLPGPIVTCNSSFGETFYIGSSSGGSVPTNDSEIHRSDYLYKGTALHLAAQIAILDVAGYCFPSVYQCLNCWSPLTDNKSLVAGFDQKSIIWRNNTQRDVAVTHEFGNLCCSVYCGKMEPQQIL